MTNHLIVSCVKEAASLIRKPIEIHQLERVVHFAREYLNSELAEFTRDLIEAANRAGIMFLEKKLTLEAFDDFVVNEGTPVLVYQKEEGVIVPLIISGVKGKYIVHRIFDDSSQIYKTKELPKGIILNQENEVAFLAIFSFGSLVSDEDGQRKLNPVFRLFKLFATEKKDIFYVFIYAALIGLISLTLPLGIQAAIELISGGVVFSSIYLMIGLVIIGVMGTGILQVLQITVVEYIQRRIFTKAAFEFAFRVPRLKMESINDLHLPELMNRFFDVLTLQKGLPKVLIDLSSGLIQIFFGLLLLSFYHPFFVFFGSGLILILVIIFYFTGPKGLKSSIVESKYKYKVVYWLEEMARTMYSFKLSGNTSLPIRRTDYNVNNYLKNRSAHFKILISQYAYVLLFKAIVTGGLLIIGTMLVVNREISLGQFVASEVIIILVLSSVEKIIMYMDVVYDMLTAVEKIAHVTDLPLEKSGGIDIPDRELELGMEIEVKDLSYHYPASHQAAVRQVSMKIPASQKVCVSGVGGSGKTTLTNVLAGLHLGYTGVLTYGGYSLRDLDTTFLRDKVGKNFTQEDLFEGTILENILVGKPHKTQTDAMRVIRQVGLADEINGFQEGLLTPILSGGKGFSTTFINKLILARCLAKQPAVLILNDFFGSFEKPERLKLIQFLTDPNNKWTLIAVSNDPIIMSACDKVFYMKNGSVLEEGTFAQVIRNENVSKNID